VSAERRARMVKEQLEARGIRDERVLQAMGKVPRERFVDEAMQARAYEDGPLPIGAGQTISQPYMAARVLELLALDGTETMLEVGVGSGYLLALMCELGDFAYGIERHQRLARKAEDRLVSLGKRRFVIGAFDGTGGWPEHAPYHAIAVSAGAPTVPSLLVDQLADGGRLVIPVGPQKAQRLAKVTRRGSSHDIEWSTPCIFVDLVGRYAWGGETPRA